MNYLTLVGGTQLYVNPAARDWSDFKIDPHIQYHRKILASATGRVTVRVNAATVPTTAALHVAGFIKLAKIVRSEFKNCVIALIISDAPLVVTAMYRALKTAGCVGTDTIGKISFITSSKKND